MPCQSRCSMLKVACLGRGKVSEEHLKLFNNSAMDLHVDRANKIMGCAVTSLWKHVVARGDPFAVVLEDDATLSQGFAEGAQVLKETFR